VLKAILVLLDLLAQRVTKAIRVTPAIKDLLVLLARLDLLDRQASRAYRESKVQLAIKDQKAIREIQD
jgi:hypothetical protein